MIATAWDWSSCKLKFWMQWTDIINRQKEAGVHGIVIGDKKIIEAMAR